MQPNGALPSVVANPSARALHSQCLRLLFPAPGDAPPLCRATQGTHPPTPSAQTNASSTVSHEAQLPDVDVPPTHTGLPPECGAGGSASPAVAGRGRGGGGAGRAGARCRLWASPAGDAPPLPRSSTSAPLGPRLRHAPTGYAPANHPLTEGCVIHSNQHRGCRMTREPVATGGGKQPPFRTARSQRTVRPPRGSVGVTRAQGPGPGQQCDSVRDLGLVCDPPRPTASTRRYAVVRRPRHPSARAFATPHNRSPVIQTIAVQPPGGGHLASARSIDVH